MNHKLDLEIKSGSSIEIPSEYRLEFDNTLKKLKIHLDYKNGILNTYYGQIGQIFTKNLTLTIKPHLDYLNTSDYLKLLIDTRLIDNNNDLEFIYEDVKISEVLIRNFLTHLKRLCRKGIPRRFGVRTEHSNFFYGEVNLERSILRKELGINPVFKTKKRYLSIDYPELKIIKLAYSKLIKSDLIDKDSLISKIFKDIETEKFDYTNYSESTKVPFRNIDFDISLDLAIIILENMSIASNDGVSLIINGNDIFEKYIFTILIKHIHPNDFLYNKKFSGLYNEFGNTLEIKPDIYYKGLNQAVIDVKNKNYLTPYKREDFFQMFSYLNILNIKDGMLIYPSNITSQRNKFLVSGNNSFSLYSITLNISYSSTKERNLEIQNFVRNINSVLKNGL